MTDDRKYTYEDWIDFDAQQLHEATRALESGDVERALKFVIRMLADQSQVVADHYGYLMSGRGCERKPNPADVAMRFYEPRGLDDETGVWE